MLKKEVRLMLSSDDVLFAIAKAYGGRISGRTAIQKIGYLIGAITDSDLGYYPHYYGPYSPTVAATLGERVASLHFRETARKPAGDFYGHDGARQLYEYELTSEGEKAAEIHRQWEPEEFSQAVDIAGKVRALLADYRQLSFAAKVHYIATQRREPVTFADIPDAAREFGWAMSERDIEEGTRVLRELGLVN